MLQLCELLEMGPGRAQMLCYEAKDETVELDLESGGRVEDLPLAYMLPRLF